jgi:hypothetical protein
LTPRRPPHQNCSADFWRKPLIALTSTPDSAQVGLILEMHTGLRVSAQAKRESRQAAIFTTSSASAMKPCWMSAAGAD